MGEGGGLLSPTLPSDQGNPLLAPFRVPIFRAVWTASIFSNLGTLMHQVGAAWLMTSMTESPLLVSLLQTAASLPVFLLGLPSGVLADLVPRRTMLLITQSWLLVVAAVLAIVTYLGAMQPWLLLVLTFCLGVGTALSLPSWQATVPDLVPRESLGAAISLNSMAFNTARAVGPAVGGLLVAAAGPPLVFLLNALSFIGILTVFTLWRPPRRKRRTTEDVIGALRAGVRYVLNSPLLHTPLLRVAAFMGCGAIVLALLPLLVREVWDLGSLGYGLLLAAFGGGSVIGAAFVPTLRERLTADGLTSLANVLAAASLFALGTVPEPWMAGIAMFGWGLAWTGSLVNFNVAVQMAVAGWVRGRVMSIYTLVLMGSMAVGASLWGWIASETTQQTAFVYASGAMLAGLLLLLRYRLNQASELDLRPSPVFVENEHLPATPVDTDEGPVLVTIEYRIEEADEARFRELMQQMRQLRKRDGATIWRLYRDTIDSMKFIELYRVETWAEHMRQRERITVSDADLYQTVRQLHCGEHPPQVSHFTNVLS